MKKKNYTLPILGGVFVIALVVMIVALATPGTAPRGEFIPPAFDETARQGVPTVAEDLGYTELYQEGMAYRVAVCGVPTVDGQSLSVYFTNAQSNEKYLKLRVLDAKGNILGETGLLRPGEYVQSVTLNRTLSPGTKITLKVMGYEPKDYTSAGSVNLNVTVGGD